MALKMTNREVDGVAVVALDGRIVLGEESNALREKVKSLMAEGKKKIVLNMDNVTHQIADRLRCVQHRSRSRLQLLQECWRITVRARYRLP